MTAKTFKDQIKKRLEDAGLLNFKEDFDEAISIYNKVLAVAPNNAEAWIQRGIAKSELGLLEEGKHDLAEALKLTPKKGI